MITGSSTYVIGENSNPVYEQISLMGTIGFIPVVSLAEESFPISVITDALTNSQLRAAPVIASDFGLDIMRGLISGIRKPIGIFGRNPDIDTTDGYETIWNGVGLYTGHNATSGEIVEIYSSSVNDNATGTGARTVTIYGLDSSGLEQFETVSMSGTASVFSTKSYLRVNFGQVITAGSGGSNAGTITCRQKITTANIFFNIPVGLNKTTVGAYTIPAGYKGYLKGWGASVLSRTNSVCELRLSIRQPGEIFHVNEVSVVSDTIEADREYPYFHFEILQPLADIRMDCNTTANNTIVACHMDLVLVVI